MLWNLNVQRLLPGQVLLEVGYIGNRTVRLWISRSADELPNSYLSTLPVRDQQTIDFLTANVPNPFANLLPGTNLNGATIARSKLLIPFPQFSGVSYLDPQGYSWYHSLRLRAERRLKHGITAQFGYSFSKLMEAVQRLNPADPMPYRSISDRDRPHQFSYTGIVELPLGRGRRLLGGAGRWSNFFFGNWDLGTTWLLTSGAPIGFGNILFYGDIKDIPLPSDQRSLGRWFNVDAGFERLSARQLSSNLRTFPLRFSGLRSSSYNEWNASLLKRFKVGDRVQGQFRLEAFNVFNHATAFDPPNSSPTSGAFGQVTGGRNYLPRNVQIGMKFAF